MRYTKRLHHKEAQDQNVVTRTKESIVPGDSMGLLSSASRILSPRLSSMIMKDKISQQQDMSPASFHLSTRSTSALLSTHFSIPVFASQSKMTRTCQMSGFESISA